MVYNVYIVCNYQDDIIYGAFRLDERALGYICNHGTIESKELIGVITPICDYVVLCCVKILNLLIDLDISLRKEVSS